MKIVITSIHVCRMKQNSRRKHLDLQMFLTESEDTFFFTFFTMNESVKCIRFIQSIVQSGFPPETKTFLSDSVKPLLPFHVDRGA